MKARTLFPRTGHRHWLLVPVLIAALVLSGCSGDDEKDASSTSSPQPQQQQGPSGSQLQSPQSLSSSDVSDEQIQQAARIATSVRMGTQEDRQKMRRDMKKKYGNPKQMDSTRKAQARKEIRRRRMKIRKKQMQIMQEEAKKEGMDPKKFRQIMRSARQDSTLRKRLQTAMKEQMRKRIQEKMKQKMQQKSTGSQ